VSLYFSLGFEHIISLMGFDHLLFIVVLCAIYAHRQWKQVLILLSGFTLGHSLTLGLTALGLISIPTKIVEFLIPITILATSLMNVIWIDTTHTSRSFLVAVLFGLIHGCGFAGYFGMMLGHEESIISPLFAFNIGLESGQILVVLLFYAVYYVLEKIRPIPHTSWTIFISGAGAGLAIKMILEAIH
jgi:HupE / UreJ protein